MKKKSYRPPAAQMFGIRTFTTPDASRGIPADTVQDKSTGEKNDYMDPGQVGQRERALPLPRGVNKDDGVIQIPRFQYNGPSGSGPERSLEEAEVQPRTRSTPGDQYGHPTKYDYHTITRRDFEGQKESMKTAFQVKYRPDKRQRRQKGINKLKAQRRYQKNKGRLRQKSKNRYKRLKNHSSFKKQQKIRRKNPSRFKRKNAHVLTAPEISFVFDKEMNLGHVRSVTSMGLVDIYVSGMNRAFTLPLPIFLSRAVMLSEADIDAFFKLVDVEAGDIAYQDVCEREITSNLDFYGISIDEKFADVCKEIAGKTDLSKMSKSQLEKVDKAIDEGLFGDKVKRTALSEEDEEQDYLEDPADDNLFYGMVNLPEEIKKSRRKKMASRIADQFFFLKK